MAVSLLEALGDLDDPRAGNARHQVSDILILAICAITAGATAWTEVERFGLAKQAWFERFLSLPHGIPSHDTFGRFFAALDPIAFRQAFERWTASVRRYTRGEVIALDGKTLRGSSSTSDGLHALHLVSAWATTNRLVLTHQPTETHSNEITALPALLRLLYLKGCVVTLDAMGTQTAIAEQIIDQGGAYVLALKSNHPTLHQDVVAYFSEINGGASLVKRRTSRQTYPNVSYATDTDGGHGRVEVRRCWASSDIAWLDRAQQWAGLRSIVMVEAERHIGEAITQARRYYLSSLPAEAARLLAVVRKHWEVENKLHWVLDVVYHEDQSRVRSGNAAENLSILRRWTLNVLRQDPLRDSLKGKRQRAGWDNTYMAQLFDIQMR